MSTPVADPEVGQLVRVRGEQWVVTEVNRSTQQPDELSTKTLPGQSIVRLSNVSGDDLGEEISLVWEVEPGREIIGATDLPPVTADGWDDPQRLGAFLDAVRWGTIASADTSTLQSPFRSGISIETYQLAPVARALAMPRVNLLIADDVGLGKTIEAGLIAQELLLRHRARRMIVVCPAPLTVKWRQEMDQKFGLEFTVLDSAALKNLRRTHGLQANPFSVYPRTIISLQWLRSPRVQRLLDEVLTEQSRHPGFFDLMIVDEAHHCAPPAPRRNSGYAKDSLQTKAVDRLGKFSHHRLFLSATPHNGHRESWQALLAMLDPQRFARGVEPDPAVVAEVMVRRLKDQLLDSTGARIFKGRETEAIEVLYSDAERTGHQLLQQYLESRRTKVGENRVRASDLVALLLKKRMFSSPVAFARTLAAHVETVRNSNSTIGEVLPDWLEEVIGWDDELIEDETSAQAETDLLFAIGAEPVSGDSAELLSELQHWSANSAGPADSKAKALLEYLHALCRPDGRWNDERVIVFTEYVDTQRWLSELLDAAKLGGDRLGLLNGGMDQTKREHLKAAFQADPQRDNVRILLATDAASEGIDLQLHCHRIVHYDIPFNPNRLEQRIGRVDRHGQQHKVLVSHFVGAGWQHADAQSYEADLEFLSRVAKKVAIEREDLGSVNPVLAQAVEAKMLGRPVWTDPSTIKPKATTQLLRAEQNLRDQTSRLRHQLTNSMNRLHVRPVNVRRVVDTGLQLAGQPALHQNPNGNIAPPELRLGWERTVLGLADPLTGTPRPMTFDGSKAGPDVVFAHLEFPLVAHATKQLRSALWGDQRALNRVSAVRAVLPPDCGVDDLLVAIFARLVVVGADGSRLHEEVMVTGRVLAKSGRGRRLELERESLSELRQTVEDAFEPENCLLATAATRNRVAQDWERLSPWLKEDVSIRATERLGRLTRDLNQRAEEERTGIQAIFAQLRKTLEAAVVGDGVQQLSFEDLDAAERNQAQRDIDAWATRLAGLDGELAAELAQVDVRYSNLRELVFPFAVVVIEPNSADVAVT